MHDIITSGDTIVDSDRATRVAGMPIFAHGEETGAGLGGLVRAFA